MIYMYMFMIFNLMKLRYIEKYVVRCFPVDFSSEDHWDFTIIIIYLQCRAAICFRKLSNVYIWLESYLTP